MISSIAAPQETAHLIRQSLRGIGVATAVAALSRLVFFAQQLVLARMLTADDFGQFAFTLLVIGLPALLVNVRGVEAIVQSERDDAGLPTLIDTAFTVQLVLAVCMVAAVAAGSTLVAGRLEKPYLSLSLAATAVLIFSATGGPSSNSGPMLLPAAVLERRLDFLRARLPELVNVIINLITSIVLATLGAGFWSLLFGYIVGSLAQVILLWRLADFHPRLRIDLPTLREYLRFGWPLYVSYLLSWAYLNADYYFVGRWLGETELGQYYMAFTVSTVLLQIRFVLSRVAFPTFARAKTDPLFLTRLYGRATRYTLALAGVMASIGIGLATPAVRVLLGEQWLPAAPALQILLLSTLIRTGLGFNGDLLISLGRTSVVLAATATALMVLLAFGPSMMTRWGIQGMAWTVCLSSISSALISSLVIRRQLPVSYVRELGPALLCIGIVAGAGSIIAPAVRGLAGFLGVSMALIASYIAMYMGLFDRAGLRFVLDKARDHFYRKRVPNR